MAPRYERVPQHDNSDTSSVSLAAVPADSTYNYNSGIPTSPPPSFHSRPSTEFDFSTVQLTPGSSQRTITAAGSSILQEGDGEMDSEATVVESSEEVIKTLRKRIETLEENIDRLLIEREANAPHCSDRTRQHGRCCVTIIDSGDAESQMRTSKHDCCVRIQPRREPGERVLWILFKGTFIVLAMVYAHSILIAFAKKGGDVKHD